MFERRGCPVFLPGKRSFLVSIFVILSIGLLSAQFSSLGSFDNNDPASAFEQSYQRGVEALATGNPVEARQHFGNAQQVASSRKDKDGKSRAKEAIKRVDRFYEPLFATLTQASGGAAGADLKTAQREWQSARELMEDYQGAGDPAFQALDQQLAARVEQGLTQVNQQRTQVVQRHLLLGQQRYQSGDFDGALAELQQAQALLLPEEESSLAQQVTQLSGLAHYQKHWSVAQRELAAENFQGALQSMRQARQYQDNPEINQRMEEVSKRLHYQALNEAQQAFFNEQYDAALAKIDTAAAYGDSEVLTRLEDSAQEILRNRGQNAVQARDFETALNWYELARQFKDDELVRGEIAQAEDLSKHHDAYADAVALLEAGKLKSARRKLRRADRFGDNPAVDTWINNIDQYYDKRTAGKKALKKGDPQGALRLFREAEQLFATSEIREYAARAERAAGAVITPDDLY